MADQTNGNAASVAPNKAATEPLDAGALVPPPSTGAKSAVPGSGNNAAVTPKPAGAVSPDANPPTVNPPVPNASTNQPGSAPGQLLLAQSVNTPVAAAPGGAATKPQATQGVPQTLSSLVQTPPQAQSTATPQYLVSSS